MNNSGIAPTPILIETIITPVEDDEPVVTLNRPFNEIVDLIDSGYICFFEVGISGMTDGDPPIPFSQKNVCTITGYGYSPDPDAGDDYKLITTYSDFFAEDFYSKPATSGGK